jgi:hypothetical protein
MPVIADAGPDQTFAFGDLPQSPLQDGDAAGGSGTFVQWQWYILDKPDGSSAAFNDSTLQNPTLNNVDVWGNYLLFLTVKDDLGEWSEEDPLLAPDSAVVHMRVEGQRTDVQKVASGERNHSRVLHEWADQLEQGAADLEAQTIAAHSDTSATGAELDELVGAGVTALHSHAGVSTPATEAALGLVKLASAPLLPAEPKAVTRNLFAFTGHVDGTMAAAGWQPGVIDVVGPGNHSKAHLAWWLGHPAAIEDFRIAMLDSGAKDDNYVFKLYEMTLGQYVANDFVGATLLATMDFATDPVTDNKPRADAEYVGATIAADNFMVLFVAEAPAGVKGGGLSFYADGHLQF